MAMDSESFWAVLKARGLTFFSGVPDSTFGEAYNYMVNDPEIFNGYSEFLGWTRSA